MTTIKHFPLIFASRSGDKRKRKRTDTPCNREHHLCDSPSDCACGSNRLLREDTRRGNRRRHKLGEYEKETHVDDQYKEINFTANNESVMRVVKRSVRDSN
eukprot:GHVN01013688.1.p1 GENE.GHVN01013688.1~~GHVN01013688.1.p1  ORF type:complete len:101 (-),score=18.29 GHVN01013688.1:346-648(-)